VPVVGTTAPRRERAAGEVPGARARARVNVRVCVRVCVCVPGVFGIGALQVHQKNFLGGYNELVVLADF
jgi:hypothetical protein